MKAILEFTVQEDKDGEYVDESKELRMALNARNAYDALNETAEKVFRPSRKHGDNDIDELLRKAFEKKEALTPGTVAALVDEVVSKLERRFYDIVEDHKVDWEDLF